MLKLSASGDYGLMFLGYLAGLPRGRYVSLATIARQRHLPLKYLERVARGLAQQGVVLSREGRRGGYALTRSPAKLKLTDVLSVLEGQVEPVVCTHDGRCCERQTACERKTGYQKVHAKLYKLLSNYSLADILPTVTSVQSSKSKILDPKIQLPTS